MSYPIVTETAARTWYSQWKEASLAEEPPCRLPWDPPSTSVMDTGPERDWIKLAEDLVVDLEQMLTTSSQGDFEREAGILLHETLPRDDDALRDADFWTWFATVPGRRLILARYAEPAQPPIGSDKPPVNPLPAANNFYGSRSRETLFFRLWIRAEMGWGEIQGVSYLYARPGLIDFWRSHVFRQLFAHHRPFLKALLDFQFPKHRDGALDAARLNTRDIRVLARELALSCANISVEALDETASAALIERVYHTRVGSTTGVAS